MDDLRNHDAKPTAEEMSWVETNPAFLLGRFFTLLAIAVSMGVACANLCDKPIRDDVRMAAHAAH
jgi:hypothetical protein